MDPSRSKIFRAHYPQDETGEDDTDGELRDWTGLNVFITLYDENGKSSCNREQQFYRMDSMMEADAAACTDCTHTSWVKLETVQDSCWGEVGLINNYGYGLEMENEEFYFVAGNTWTKYPDGLSGGVSSRAEWTENEARLFWNYDVELGDGTIGKFAHEEVFSLE